MFSDLAQSWWRGSISKGDHPQEIFFQNSDHPRSTGRWLVERLGRVCTKTKSHFKIWSIGMNSSREGLQNGFFVDFEKTQNHRFSTPYHHRNCWNTSKMVPAHKMLFFLLKLHEIPHIFHPQMFAKSCALMAKIEPKNRVSKFLTKKCV